MERYPVTSTSLRSVGYDPQSKLLEIEFTNGKVYRYRDVPLEMHKDLLRSESLGKFFNTKIRDVYSYEEITQS